MKRKAFLVSILALVMLVPALLISATTAASDRHDDDDGDNDTATCADLLLVELLLEFGGRSDDLNNQRIEALAKARSDPEEAGEVWAEYFEELADLFEDFGEDLADVGCPFPF